MPFTWDEFLPFAERLTADSDDEVLQRTAINRAYYAAYHNAADYVRRRGLLTARHTHHRVWAALLASPDPGDFTLGRRGDRLRRLRIAADYQNPFPGQLDDRARQAVAMARAIIAGLGHNRR